MRVNIVSYLVKLVLDKLEPNDSRVGVTVDDEGNLCEVFFTQDNTGYGTTWIERIDPALIQRVLVDVDMNVSATD